MQKSSVAHIAGTMSSILPRFVYHDDHDAVMNIAEIIISGDVAESVRDGQRAAGDLIKFTGRAI